MTKIDREAGIKIFRPIIQQMDVPEHRVDDYQWLLRNLAFRNSDHPDFQRVIQFIKQMLRPDSFINI